MIVPDEIESRIIRAQIDMMRLEASIQRDVLGVLRGLEKSLVSTLVAIDPTRPIRAAFQEQRLNKLLDEVRTLIRSTYKDAYKELEKGLADSAELASEHAANAINAPFGVSLAHTITDVSTLKNLAGKALIEGAHSKEWWDNQANSTVDRFMREIRKGMALSESIGYMARRIRGYKPKDGPRVNGIMDLSKIQAELLVRTSVISVSNNVRLATYDSNDQFVRGIQWVSTLDSRTTPICQQLDGLTWDNDRKPLGHGFDFPGPTAHWGCRSTQMPLLRSWSEFISDPKLAKKLDLLEIDGGTRASIGGQVPKSTNYETWLKVQPKDTQIEVLGKQRLELWQQGAIKFTDLVDQRGHPRTLKELRGNLGAK